MDKKNQKKIIQKKGKYYSEHERHSIIREMLKNKWTKQYAWELYTGEPEERGQLMRWMRHLGYAKVIKHKKFRFGAKITPMHYGNKEEPPGSETFENLQLKKRIADLEKQLRDSEMKAIAFSTMVDIAEKEFNIPIRKKLNTKPLKK